MKVQIACADGGFPSDIKVNRNPDCIYYSNQRVCLSPEAQWSYERDNNGLCEHSVFTIAELIECLPGVYTRTLKTAVDEIGTEDGVDMGVHCFATQLFTTIAAYMNAWNDFVKEHLQDHDGATGLPKHYDVMYGKYIVGEELAKFRKRYSRVRTTVDELPDGRRVKVQFFYYSCRDDEKKDYVNFDYGDIDGAVGFSFELVEKEA